MDIKMAFLNGPLKEEQAPRAWYDELSNFLMSKGFTKGTSDPTLFTIRYGEAKYALEILKKHGMERCESLGTSLATKPKLDADFSGTPDSGFELTAFSDADHAGCIDTRKSTSGGKFLGDKLVSWMSKKHDCTTMLLELEYVALSTSYAQVIWMRTNLKHYGFDYNKIPLYCDSQSAIAISCNPVQHSHTKHINVRYHFIKE
ncbi:retrovirus-related pol polyprotein from transposon TNT 1-94 [Tanacetum coccineum]